MLAAEGLQAERVYKVKEGRPNVVDLIKGDRIQLIVNTPAGQDPYFDEKAIRRAAVLARIPTITTLAAARAAIEGIEAIQQWDAECPCVAQNLHAEREAEKSLKEIPSATPRDDNLNEKGRAIGLRLSLVERHTHRRGVTWIDETC